MKIRPVTVRRCIVYPVAAVATGVLCSCDRTEAPKAPKEQPEQLLEGIEPKLTEAAIKHLAELQKQAEKRGREDIEESGAVMPPTASETDTESEAADSEAHS
ncbi:MAG: hypothetical protein ACI4OZ_05530 [Akkermansia sp.]